jgi:hypothetical protein
MSYFGVLWIAIIGWQSLQPCHALAGGRVAAGKGFGVPTTSTKDLYQPDPSSQALLNFLTSQKGAHVKNVAIGISRPGHRRGLYATKAFGKAGAIVCKIPSDCALVLVDPAGTDTPSLVECGANFLRMYYNNCSDDKWWKPYLDCLPQVAESSTPNMWSEEEIELMEFPRIVNQAKKRRNEILKPREESSKDLLEYATWLVTSRAFPIRVLDNDNRAVAKNGTLLETAKDNVLIDDRGQIITKASSKFIPCLVPLLDMANHHSSQPNAKLTLIDPEKDDAYFALEALRPIAAGKEITIAYGSGVDSSVELLLNYGFVDVNDNAVDRFILKKGGDDCIASVDGWTTTLEEDEKVLDILRQEPNADHDESLKRLKKILTFRLKLKKSYQQ